MIEPVLGGVILRQTKLDWWLPPDPELDASIRLLEICSVLAPKGAVRLLGAMRSVLANVEIPNELKNEQLALFNRTSYCSGVLKEIEGFSLGKFQEREFSLSAIPLIVITRGKRLAVADLPPDTSSEFIESTNSEWSKRQGELAARSTRSEQWIATNSGHAIPYQEPEIIVRAVKEMLAIAQ